MPLTPTPLTLFLNLNVMSSTRPDPSPDSSQYHAAVQNEQRGTGSGKIVWGLRFGPVVECVRACWHKDFSFLNHGVK